MVHEDRLLFRVGQRAPEVVLAILELRSQVLGELVDDVVCLVCGQVGPDVLEISIEGHGGSP